MVDEIAFKEMEIEDGFNAEQQLATAMAPTKKSRARKSVAKKASPAAGLIEALKFISIAQKKVGDVYQQFCFLGNNWAAASNEILLVATKIEEDLNACPHTLQMLDALGKCKDELAMVQLTESSLSINSDKFKALIPCVDASNLRLGSPDPLCAAIDDRLKTALANVMHLTTEGAEKPILGAVLLQANTVVATSGFAMIEAFHGIDLPPGLLIPKIFAMAIVKCNKPLKGFGFSNSSVTFYFEDESFIKTQLYSDRFPHYEALLDCSNTFKPLPREFFIAVHAIQSFSQNGIVYFEKEFMSANEPEVEGTTYKIKNLPEGMAFNAKYLIQIEKQIEKVFFDKELGKMFFIGDNLRGALMGCKHKISSEEVNNTTDDIPY